MEELLVILICLVLNAFLSATEMAFVTVGKPRLRELSRTGNTEAKKILALRENPERTLSVIQVGITLVGAIAAAVGGAGAEELVSPIVQDVTGFGENGAEFLSILLVVIPISYLSVVVGELVPKSLALRDPLKIVLRAARWLVLCDRVLAPVVFVLEWSTKKFLSVFFRKARIAASVMAPDTVELDQLSHQARQYVANLVGMEKKRVLDIYLPWTQVVSIRQDQSIEEVELAISTSGHTRIPVTSNGSVTGIVNAKEFLAFLKTGEPNWLSIVRSPVRVTDTDTLLAALKTMQDRRSHMSIVIRGGERIGIITMEDILEEIIGDIFDEDDDGAVHRLLAKSGSYRGLGPRSD